MEGYLNKVKQLSDQLKAKKLALPDQIVIAWVLNNLSDNYEGFISSVTQSFRTNSGAYTLESLFANLLDESKRHMPLDKDSILYTRYKGRKPYKITKGKFCKYCKLASHDIKSYYFLFPEKAPKSWKKIEREVEDLPERVENPARKQRDENIHALFEAIPAVPVSAPEPEMAPQVDIDFGAVDEIIWEDIQVFITTHNKNNNSIYTNNNKIDKYDLNIDIPDFLKNRSNSK